MLVTSNGKFLRDPTHLNIRINFDWRLRQRLNDRSFVFLQIFPVEMLASLALLHRQAVNMINITVELGDFLLLVFADEPAGLGRGEADVLRV